MKKNQKHFLVCLTGGVASGKTCVSDKFEALGVEVIDTDILARKVVSPWSKGLNQIVHAFGEQVLNDEGGLDRSRLRALVFNDTEKRHELNEITHPLIHEEVMRAINLSDSQVIVVVIPLYSGQKNYQFFDRVCVVDVNKVTQLSRLQLRDGIDKNLALKMVAAQMQRKERLLLADDVIVNDGSLESLNGKAKQMHRYYQNCCM